MEHNLLSASRIYTNITFSGLGALLNLTPSAAEAMARTMVQQKRLRASIDQVDGLISFELGTREGEGAVSNVAAGADEEAEREEGMGAAPHTARWDLACVDFVSFRIVSFLRVERSDWVDGLIRGVVVVLL